MINQRVLSSRFEIIHLDTYQSVLESIKNITARGAPAIGVAAAFGMVLAALQSKAADLAGIRTDLNAAAQELLGGVGVSVDEAGHGQLAITVDDFL